MNNDILKHRLAVMNNIEKSFNDEFENEIEKAYAVGDVLFLNNKQYVWTEYAQGKYDWHIVKNNKVIQGKGVNGLHGLKALTKLYDGLDKSYTDPSAMMLKRTPNGHWRMYYNSNDVGHSIDGDVVTESELMSDDVCYQNRRVVDNFDLVSDYMEFNSPDDVYFIQVIKRWKDNKDKPEANSWKAQGKAQGTYHSGAEYMNYYLIHSKAELDAVKSEITKACTYNNARAYISINSRNQTQSNQYISQLKSKYGANDPRGRNAEPIVYGMAKSGANWRNERLKVLLDIDTTKDSEVTINGKKLNVWDETKRRLTSLGIKVSAEYETPSGGLHLILNNKNNRNLDGFYKNLKDFDGGKNLDKLATVHPSEDIKMVLYSNVVTEGY